ncbi:hypothetical protein EJ04DRAFT_519409 [Polyplosphaeria fusca]|uniref:Uncharacterized protein n=1 Tax=Polyplosphaeria fusca TaxID=682080 RepID=A0A9P4V6F4_9PLEO|nr:hypothetical protein EJ04DRAFT_519409 [Polyplosphaeria fusca]
MAATAANDLSTVDRRMDKARVGRSPNQSLDDLKAIRRLSTTVDNLREDEMQSTYHVYHSRDNHQCVSASIDPSKERWCGPTIKEDRAERKTRRIQRKQREDSLVPVNTTDSDDSSDSYYLHTPYLAFHDPPRVLFIGSTKYCEPAVLIHNSTFWHTWKLQLGPSIATPGLLDPRGVVSWRHNGGDSQALKADDTKLKGYKVRTWRLWGETGKSFVHGVKAARNTGHGPDPDILEDEIAASRTAAKADEVVYLKWVSPFSKDTRKYHFRFHGIDFYWKGTGTVKESRTCGWFVHFNHLKLVACLPQESKTGPTVEVCLGKYQSSVAVQKSGKLVIFDAAIARFMAENIPSAFSHSHSDEKGGHDDEVAKVTAVKRTLLHQVIVATAMCMVIGEQQKRETLRHAIALAGGEGANAGG